MKLNQIAGFGNPFNTAGNCGYAASNKYGNSTGGKSIIGQNNS
jgi:hypothetical protein